jgi:ABC-2 type transport system ATP-binding protein
MDQAIMCILIERLSFSYDEKENILNDLSMDFPSGSVIGVVGENGAGKTTLFDILSNNLLPSSGKIQYFECLSDEISYIPQYVTLSQTLTIKEIVSMIAILNESSFEDVHNSILLSWTDPMKKRFYKILNRRSNVCSYGEKRWFIISILLTVFKNKKFFILDEPTAGVDIHYRYLLWDLIRNVRNTGATIIVSSHILEEIGENSDFFYFLKNGKAARFESLEHFKYEHNASSISEAFINAVI